MQPSSLPPFYRVFTPLTVTVNDGPPANLTSYEQGHLLVSTPTLCLTLVCLTLTMPYSGMPYSCMAYFDYILV